MIKILAKLLKALNTNVNSAELAHAFSCGFILGFMPKNNVFWYLVFIFILFIKINKPVYLLAVLLSSFIAPFADSYFDTVGYAFLTIPELSDIFAKLIEIPFVGFTKFNNTVVMGSFLCGLILYIPLYFIAKAIVYLWRKYVAERIRNTKLAKGFQALPFVTKVQSLMEDK